ncbi:MAG: DUF4367 domain-containing protein [Clostridiales bacterium]|nr:DUF4367 domain-containing protein [Clostridiales bacterium]
MKKQSRDERERVDKLNETFLYNMGYEHAQNTCDEVEALLGEYRDIEVPESLNEWFLEHQKQHNKKIKRAIIRKKAVQISKRVAMIILAICIVSAAVTMSVEAFRIRFFNMIIEINERFSTIQIEEKSTIGYIHELPQDWDEFYYPTILPRGYKLKKVFEANNTKYIIFINCQMDELYFVQGPINTDFQMDTENAKVIKVDINGMEGIIIEKEKSNIISWHDNNKSYYIQGNVEKTMLLRIAESLVKK